MGDIEMGIVGLGVMGRNLALNIADKGFSVAGWDAWPDAVARFAKDATGPKMRACETLEGFVASLRKPRKIILLVKAGEVTEETIIALLPHLEAGDLLVDGGNEHFRTTERRAREVEAKGVRYFGMGVSGGEEGARHGPSMMPGGDEVGYRELEPVLTKIAAQTEDGPCVTYIGKGGSGHYVKMVHNGIEYADMQLIAEAYDALKRLGGLSNAELAEVFERWNQGELQSYLVEITAKIFRKADPQGQGELVDAILDSAAQKGTGAWAVEDAAAIGVAIPTINSAVEARLLSSLKEERMNASKLLAGPSPSRLDVESQELVDDVHAALYASKIVSYAQGMALLQRASTERSWNLRLSEMARIWQGGCIIRARLLGAIRAAYEAEPSLVNLMLDGFFRGELASRQRGWRRILSRGVEAGLPMPSTSAALAYYDGYRSERLPANLTQAQRDFFGAHTYRRLDREGSFHTAWEG